MTDCRVLRFTHVQNLDVRVWKMIENISVDEKHLENENSVFK